MRDVQTLAACDRTRIAGGRASRRLVRAAKANPVGPQELWPSAVRARRRQRGQRRRDARAGEPAALGGGEMVADDRLDFA